MQATGWLKEVYQKIDEHFEGEHLPRILGLVRQPSIAGTGEGIAECAGMVMQMLRDLGCEDVHLEHYVRSPVVEGFLRSDTPDAPTIVMYGMYDVQPPEPLDEWTVPPFAGTIKEYGEYGECVVSRGIANSKGPLVCFINAVYTIREVLGHLPFHVLFVVEGEEECGSESLAQYVKKHSERLSKCDVVFLNGCRQDKNGRPTMNLGNKGILYLDLECRGGDWGGPREVDVHSKNAAWVSSPVWRMVNALATMRDADDNILIEGFYDDVVPPSPTDERVTETMVAMADGEMSLKKDLTAKRFIKGWDADEATRHLIWDPTLNICGLHGGYEGPASKTILPHKITAKIDVRLVPNMTAEKTLERIRAHLEKHGYGDISIKQLQGNPFAKVDPDCLEARAAFAALESFETDRYGAWPIFPGSGPRFLFTSEPVNLPFITYGLGQWGRIHAPDEWVTVRGLCDNEKSCAAYLYFYLREREKDQKERAKQQ